MKKNRPIIFILLFLAIVAVVLFTQNNSTTLQEKESGFAIADTSAITKIFIADKQDHTVLLERKGNAWQLDGKYVAHPKMIETLLGTMYQMKVKAPVSNSSHNNVVNRMATIGIKVEIYKMAYRINLFDKIKLFQHERLAKVFYVGDATQDMRGSYLLMEGAERPYVVYLPYLRGYISTRFSPMEDAWKSHNVFNSKLIDIQSLAIYFGNKSESSFRVDINDARGNYELTALVNNRKVTNYDTLKVLNLLTSFADLRYETRLNNLFTPEKIDSIISSPFLYKISINDRKKGETTVKMFKRNAIPDNMVDGEGGLIPVDHDRFYAQINDGEDFVLMQYFVFDRVLMPLEFYEK